MKRIVPPVVCACLLLTALSGCQSSIEVEQLAVVAGFSIDLNEQNSEKPLLMTFEVMDLGGDASGKSSGIASKIIQTEGVGAFDAVRSASTKSTNRLYFAHAKVLVLGEAVARKGLGPYLDWVMRDAEPRPTLRLLVAKQSMGSSILDARYPINPVTSYGIEDVIINDANTLAHTPAIRLYEAFNNIYEAGIDLVLPTIEIQQNKVVTEPGQDQAGKAGQQDEGSEEQQSQGEQDNGGNGDAGSGGEAGGGGESQESSNTTEKMHALVGSAVFREDKLVGYLSGEQSKYMMYVTDQIKGGLLNLPLDEQNKDAFITYEVFDSTTSKKVNKLEDGSFSIDVKIKTEVALGEQGPGVYRKLKNATYEQLQEAAGKALKSRIEQVIKLVQQEYGADVFGFGQAIYKRYPKQWKEIEQHWYEILQTLPVNVEVEVSIRNTGHVHLN